MQELAPVASIETSPPGHDIEEHATPSLFVLSLFYYYFFFQLSVAYGAATSQKSVYKMNIFHF